VALANLGKLKDPESWMKDMGACMENILLEAVYLGLGAVWLGMDTGDAKRHIRGIFNLPDNIESFAIASIGYPAEGRENKFLDHYDAAKVHWERYSEGR
jgi:nitroreductase